MSFMHRTQISLEKDQYDLLTREARRRGLSLSALLRQLIGERYQKAPARRRPADPLRAITGIASGTGEAVGRKHNKFLYGSRRG